MNRAAHPMLAGLCRAGGAPARLMAALERAQTRLDAFEIDLETHPLCASGAWEALILEVAEAESLLAILARLARSGDDAESGRLPRLAAVQEASDAARPGGEAVARAGAAAAALPLNRQGLADRKKPRPETPSSPGAAKLAEVRPPSVAAARAGEKPSWFAGDGMKALDPLLWRAGTRRIGSMKSTERAAAVARILEGAPLSRQALTVAEGSAAVQAPVGTTLPVPTAVQQYIESALTRLGQERRETSSVTRAPERSAPSTPVLQRQPEPLAAPASGLQRLLARGQHARSMVPEDVAVVQRRAAPAHPLRTQEPAVGTPSLGRPMDRARTELPSALAEPALAEDPGRFARALADLLQCEARSAGVDLGGGS